jgi:hypothetical protein
MSRETLRGSSRSASLKYDSVVFRPCMPKSNLSYRKMGRALLIRE